MIFCFSSPDLQGAAEQLQADAHSNVALIDVLALPVVPINKTRRAKDKITDVHSISTLQCFRCNHARNFEPPCSQQRSFPCRFLLGTTEEDSRKMPTTAVAAAVAAYAVAMFACLLVRLFALYVVQMAYTARWRDNRDGGSFSRHQHP